MNIALLGFGVVGGGVLEAVLHLHHQHPKTRK